MDNQIRFAAKFETLEQKNTHIWIAFGNLNTIITFTGRVLSKNI